jgi:hypothetical protein
LRPTRGRPRIAQRANKFGRAKTLRTFGAPVTDAQVRYYEQALNDLRKSKTIAQFLGFRSTDAALRALRPCAQGYGSAADLPTQTRDSFDKLYKRLTALYAADGKVNKTWPRKHAIVIVALLTEKRASD